MTSVSPGGSSAATTPAPDITSPRSLYGYTLALLSQKNAFREMFHTSVGLVWVSFEAREDCIRLNFYEAEGWEITRAYILSRGRVRLTCGAVAKEADNQADHIQFITRRLVEAGAPKNWP